MADTLITGTTLIETKVKVDIKPTEDGASFDFTEADMTTDGTFRSLDISSIVPSGTEWIIVTVNADDNLVDQTLNLNGTGTSNFNRLTLSTQVANQNIAKHGWIKINPQRLLYYQASSTTWTNINIKIVGYV